MSEATSRNSVAADAVCPCGSKRSYGDCCGPLHSGGAAPTAERLMRSRYSAFVLEDDAYLLRSWHPSTRPPHVEFDHDLAWRRLQIVDTVAGGERDDAGIVEFRAAFRDGTGVDSLHERSRFTRVDGAWVYLDGDLID